jgi:hypothetical protein
VGRQTLRIEEWECGIGFLRSANALLDGKIAKMKQRRWNIERRWSALAMLMQSAEASAEKDERGYCLDELMRALVAISRPVPKTPWKTPMVPGYVVLEDREQCFRCYSRPDGIRPVVF